MPRNVRNFWVDLKVDGNQPVATGPRNKDGGFSLIVFQRTNGDIMRAIEINGRALADGTLSLKVLNKSGVDVHTVTTKR